jgi:putative ABC transport system permease protein
MKTNNRKKPPRLAEGILKKILDENVSYSAAGDIEEAFYLVQSRRGRIAGCLWYGIQVILCIPKFLFNSMQWSLTMYKNYLKTAGRNLVKHKTFSLINIAGLSIGMTCFILIMLFINYELSFDSFHKDAAKIYRVFERQPGNVFRDTDLFAKTPAKLAPALMEEIPDVECVTRVNDYLGKVLLTYNDKPFYHYGVSADEYFFQLFSYKLRWGEKDTVLKKPYTIALSQDMADEIFAGDYPVGKVLNYGGNVDVTVSGVFENMPGNSHIQCDFILSWETLMAIPGQKKSLDNWNHNSLYTYVKFKNQINKNDIGKKMNLMVHKNYETKTEYFLQSLQSIHLHSHANFEFSANYDIRYIYLFTAIAMIILIIACINYMNLSVSRSLKRAKEIGIRKVSGAQRRQLIAQLMGESLLLSAIAFMISIISVIIILPYFSSFIGRKIGLGSFQRLSFSGFLVVIFILVSVVSGGYPALTLSSFHPVRALKSTLIQSKSKLTLRNGLVMIQFCAAIILIAGTIIVNHQLGYIRTSDIGYNRERIIVMPIRGTEMRNRILTMKQELVGYSGVKNVSLSSWLPHSIVSQNDRPIENNSGGLDRIPVYYCTVDWDFIPTMEMKLVQGRNFSKDFSNDSRNSVIVNETLAKMMGWDNPIGKKIRNVNYQGTAQVIGVVKDFNFLSFHHKIEPITIFLMPERCFYLYLRADSLNMKETLSLIEKTYKKFSGNFPFEYFFLDDYYSQAYESELKLGVLFVGFSFLAIFISCLGLYALSLFTVEKRTKEIGIRKVVGAKTSDVFILLSKEFMALVALATIIAVPIIWLSFGQWLENFTYRVGIEWWNFILSGLAALVIALITVAYHTVKAARANPVDSLRYE